MVSSPELSDDEYELIASTLSVTDKGRAFLRMHAERSRSIAGEDIRLMLRDELQTQLGMAAAGSEHVHARFLYKELQEMSECITQARAEIAALVPTEDGGNRIVAATGELDAIVSATERATTVILTSTERIQELIEGLSDQADTGRIRSDIEHQVTEILMACSFQDITGQRTSKVVNTLRYIEQRVNAMMEIWGVEAAEAAAWKAPLKAPADTREDAHLLNGPALEGGVSQDDVDAMFDAPTAVEGARSEACEGEASPAQSSGSAADDDFARPGEASRDPECSRQKKQKEIAAAPAELPSGESVSQADIDALFD